MYLNKNISSLITLSLWLEMVSMIKQMAWNTFKNTGDINTYLELVEVKNIEKNMVEADKQNGNIKDKGNSNSGTQYERLW